MLQPIRQAKTKTASRVRGRISSVLAWVTEPGYRDGRNAATWLVLGWRMKAGKDHRVPLSGSDIEMIQREQGQHLADAITPLTA